MPLVASDIVKRLSGGASNSDVNLSIGGIKSSTAIADATLHNLFDCFYFHNAHASLTALSSKVWIQTNTPSTGTTVEIGLGAAAVSATETAVANESTAPAGVTFTATAIDLATGLLIGDIPFGQHKAVWVKRVISASSPAFNTDNVLIRFGADTNQ